MSENANIISRFSSIYPTQSYLIEKGNCHYKLVLHSVCASPWRELNLGNSLRKSNSCWQACICTVSMVRDITVNHSDGQGVPQL